MQVHNMQQIRLNAPCILTIASHLHVARALCFAFSDLYKTPSDDAYLYYGKVNPLDPLAATDGGTYQDLAPDPRSVCHFDDDHQLCNSQLTEACFAFSIAIVVSGDVLRSW